MPRKPSQKQIDRTNEARVAAIYKARCSGVQVPLLKIPAIMRVGVAAVVEGCDDQVVGDKLVAFIATL
jgi:hypothetical protein